MKDKGLRIKDCYLILHNIRSAHNVGAIFRTADAAGVSKVYLTGYTPSPVDRFGRPRKDIAKAALDAEKTIAWEQSSRIAPLLKKLKADGFRVIALEQDKTSTDYRKIKSAGKIAIILGNEVTGIPKNILRTCDEIAEIPMRGQMVRQAHHPRHMKSGKESLNVSVAAGIMLFRMTE